MEHIMKDNVIMLKFSKTVVYIYFYADISEFSYTNIFILL